MVIELDQLTDQLPNQFLYSCIKEHINIEKISVKRHVQSIYFFPLLCFEIHVIAVGGGP